MLDEADDEQPSRRLTHEVKRMNIRSGRSASRREQDDEGRASARGDDVDARRASLKTAGDSRSHTPVAKSHSPVTLDSTQASPRADDGDEEARDEGVEVIGGDIAVVQNGGEPPKLARTASRKITTTAPRLFDHLPDATDEAQGTYKVIESSLYANKYLGVTDHAMECDCTEEWDPETKRNHACGEDSDCINRATKMECVADCSCGSKCQNRRFQRRKYAKVSVIRTEKKGYGLRADTDLPEHAFIFEYVGEVIGEQAFRRRMQDYDQEGIKHFYFMSLSKGEFIDATKKGNKGRFCNHSCRPNCYVDKWVVGDQLRMGIFTDRRIAAGEELVFNYNVDRYGANPQPCYCGEPNCTGFIGGKTQTERATKLPATTIEALGIEAGDDWDLAVAKKSRKKKASENDEEYIDHVKPKSLDEAGVVGVMATLMQCKEKWIAVKLLARIEDSEDERVRARVMKMHGYQILKLQLTTWLDDDNICLQVLRILNSLPRITRNKIQESGIEVVVQRLVDKCEGAVHEEAEKLLAIWQALPMGFRIARHKTDPTSAAAPAPERRQRSRSRDRSKSRSRSVSPPNMPKGPSAPSGPRAGVAPGRGGYIARGGTYGRGGGFNNARGGGWRGGIHGSADGLHWHGLHDDRPRHKPAPETLPAGWFVATARGGRPYYYNLSGETTWLVPTSPAAQPPPPPKISLKDQELDNIIKSITAEPVPKPSEQPSTPVLQTQPVDQPREKETPVNSDKPKEKWMKYPVEKQMKLYENTLFPHVKYVMDKYTRKLPRDDLKRFAKECATKIVTSDYKHNRVVSPMVLTDKQIRGVKAYCKDYFDRAVDKMEQRDARRKANASKDGSSSTGLSASEQANEEQQGRGLRAAEVNGAEDHDVNMDIYDDEGEGGGVDEPTSTLPLVGDVTALEALKRKRGGAENGRSPSASPRGQGRNGDTPLKRQRSEVDMDSARHTPDSPLGAAVTPAGYSRQPPPPPPPPPPSQSAPHMMVGGPAYAAMHGGLPEMGETYGGAGLDEDVGRDDLRDPRGADVYPGMASGLANGLDRADARRLELSQGS